MVIDGKTLSLLEGNIALLDVDALVNAANTSLILGSGVAGAIRRFGGPSIQEECDKLVPLKVGEAVITGGGNLKARHVIHAVGPIQGEGREEEKLTRATFNSLLIARDRKFRSIAFPAISTGVYGFPLRECSEIMLRTALNFLRENDHPREVFFCLFGDEALMVFKKTLEKFGR
jgi:O-acetyl-ADP-ribose deacetylase (regulator of RNase III)